MRPTTCLSPVRKKRSLRFNDSRYWLNKANKVNIVPLPLGCALDRLPWQMGSEKAPRRSRTNVRSPRTGISHFSQPQGSRATQTRWRHHKPVFQYGQSRASRTERRLHSQTTVLAHLDRHCSPPTVFAINDGSVLHDQHGLGKAALTHGRQEYGELVFGLPLH